MAERCVCCGEIIPEGRQVCPNCENVPLREKLVDIYNELEEAGLMVTAGKAAAADLLIAKGVTVQRWIPVTERLPDDSVPSAHYLCYWNGHIRVVKYWRTQKEFILMGKTVKVTHWMPLPEPPKGE